MNKKPLFYMALFLAFIFAVGSVPNASAPPVNEPDYIYLICTSDPAHTINVSWRTDENYVGEVHYDTESQDGTPGAYSYSTEGTGGVTTSEFEGYIHHVELIGLEPATTYYFICGGENQGWSEEYSFRTAPANRENIRFVVGGDSRTDIRYHYPEWPEARDDISRLMASYEPDFVIFIGDYLWDGEVQPGGDTWDNWLGALFKYWRADNNRLIPIIPVIGNHELEPYPVPPVYDPMEDASNYYMLFDLPENEGWYAWYSLDWGPDLHITILDSEIRDPDSEIWNEQVEWLSQDLNEHYEFLWKIAADHRPIFVHIPYQERVDLTWEFDKFHLDMMFSGHEHYYERSHPLNFFYPEGEQITEPENGTIYVITGGWGAPNYPGNPHWYSVAGPIEDYHFTLVDLLDNGMLHSRAVNIDNEIIDEFTIQKEVSTPGPPSGEPPEEELPILPIAVGVVVVGAVVAFFTYLRK